MLLLPALCCLTFPAQACVIWSRLDGLFGGGGDFPEEEPAPEEAVVEMPAFGLQGDETVQGMMNRINAATPGGAERVLILTGVDHEKDTYTACELKKNGKVKWSDWGPISGLVDSFSFTTVYKRW